MKKVLSIIFLGLCAFAGIQAGEGSSEVTARSGRPADTQLLRATDLEDEALALEGVKAALAAGADIEAPCSELAQTPLMYAARRGFTTVVDHLLACGAKVNAQSDGWTALMQAATQHKVETVKTLLAHKADPNLVSGTGCTALGLLIELGKKIGPDLHRSEEAKATIILLLEAGIAIDAPAYRDYTPLELAALYDDEWMVTKFLEYNPNILQADSSSRTVFDSVRSSKIAKLLLDRVLASTADVNQRAKNGETLLMLAAKSGCADTVKVLLDKGANILLTTTTSPYRTAIAMVKTPEVTAILENTLGLFASAQSGHSESAEKELVQGARVNARDNFGMTPLMYAAAKGCTPIVDAILKTTDVELNYRNINDQTAYMLAAINDHTAIADTLKAAGAEITADDLKKIAELAREKAEK
jgi:ankyrin repeat protein